METVKIGVQNVILRKWQKGDEDSLVRHADNMAVAKFLKDSFPKPYTYSDAVQWIRFANRSIDSYNLAITLNDKVIGAIGVEKQQDVYRKSAELGYWLGEEYWNKGIMTNVVKEMVELAFQNFSIVRLYAYVFSGNKASSVVLEKAGFELESIQKSAIYKNGQFMDQMVYTIVRV
ncbi:GNAT family N-acetyltransferase [Marinifilum caeruleilacunae]|uniref:N-acetyltransferase n=1 Tax=Marinifilum caeruleilacunae TaxID=2499076 RepID=A0ABX1WS76_9BACT|nr:GNAT family N-acetyltransferase [Marinifilum caeruleilacunae]NOU58948.1 N-acetyltransferase [Marinifilum caeruleilacunae]